MSIQYITGNILCISHSYTHKSDDITLSLTACNPLTLWHYNKQQILQNRCGDAQPKWPTIPSPKTSQTEYSHFGPNGKTLNLRTQSHTLLQIWNILFAYWGHYSTTLTSLLQRCVRERTGSAGLALKNIDKDVRLRTTTEQKTIATLSRRFVLQEIISMKQWSKIYIFICCVRGKQFGYTHNRTVPINYITWHKCENHQSSSVSSLASSVA